MAIHVVESYPSRDGFRRFMRFVVAAIGMIILLVGMLAAALDLLVAGLVVMPGGARTIDTTVLTYVGVLTGATIVGIWLGVRALRGRRRLGLFLRRFGYREATQTMSAVVAGRSGRRWRMVTLDDANIAPVGTAKPRRRLAVVIMVLGLALAGYGIYAVFVQGITVTPKPSTPVEGQSVAQQVAGDIVASIAVAIVGALLIVAVIAFAAVSLVIGVAGGLASRAAKASHERASVVIGRGDEVAPATAAVRRNNRRVFGSRMVVCRVANPLWQDVVRQLAAVSDAVVIDVSHPTDNVVWEVETMHSAADLRWVLVCHRDRVAMLREAAGADADADAAAVRLAQLLDGQQVLVYGNSPIEQRRFARSLRNRLDTAARAKRA